MSANNGHYYQSQADHCAQEAEAADLPLLREKFLRSQRAWQALADRSHQMETGRLRKLAEAAAQAAE